MDSCSTISGYSVMDKTLSYEQAKEKALRLLEFRSHSQYELKEKLLHKGAIPEDIDKIMEFLLEYSFIDDEKYAYGKARELINLKKHGKMRVAQDLRARGISSEIIDSVLDEIEIDEKDILLPLVRKKLKGDFEKKNIEKAIRYFGTRGYNISDIKASVDEIKSEAERYD